MPVVLSQLSTLLVEPSKAQHNIIEGYLRDIGVSNIMWAQTGLQALNCLENESVELIITAMHLEDMTGTDLMLKIRTGEINRNVPLMLVSSETSYRYLEPIRQAGVIATLPKPFKRDQLEKALYATLDLYDPDLIQLKIIEREDFKILLVDDSEMSRRHIRNLLIGMGLENISEASNGHEGLQMVNENFYDLIVTDFYMPVMNGEEFVEHIRKDSSQASVPILMVSSEANESRLAGVRQAGVSAICDKPFEPKLIKQMIERIIQN